MIFIKQTWCYNVPNLQTFMTVLEFLCPIHIFSLLGEHVNELEIQKNQTHNTATNHYKKVHWRKIINLFFGILWSRYKRNSFHVTKIHIIAKHVYVKHFPNIFLFLIWSQSLKIEQKSKKKINSVSLTASRHGSDHLINNSSFWDICFTTWCKLTHVLHLISYI
jgi:hypothetical protein